MAYLGVIGLALLAGALGWCCEGAAESRQAWQDTKMARLIKRRRNKNINNRRY